MLNPLRNRGSTKKPLSYGWMKSNFIHAYGYDCWKEVSLKEFFEMLPELKKDVDAREYLRLATLKHYGVKNPK